MNNKAFPVCVRCTANAVLMKLSRTLILVFILLSLSSASCAQRNQEAGPVGTVAPHVLWKFDTGG